jgi:hypothetical protein
MVIAQGLIAAADIGMKEHDRLMLAKTMMDRKLEGRKTLDVTPQAARRIVLEVVLREMTGRGRCRAWEIM